jgi:glutamate--cysteine ligase
VSSAIGPAPASRSGTADGASALSRADLRRAFAEPGRPERVGIEVETAAMDPATGKNIPYWGRPGIQQFLTKVLREYGGEPCLDRGNVIGGHLPDGGKLSLEHGGAVEYSSPPAGSVVEVVTTTRSWLERLAEVAGHLGFALVPGGNFPFTTIDTVPLVPHERGDIMRRFFAALGPSGRAGPHVMSLVLSTQTTLDYIDEHDFRVKLRMLSAVSAVAAALFVNSPLEGGRPCGALSRRMQYWSTVDPPRTRIIAQTCHRDAGIEDVIDWALSLPMIFRKVAGYPCRPAPPRPFRELLAADFDEEPALSADDWRAHLDQIFSDVRVRRTLEARALDGPPYAAFAAVPAFWTGLAYSAPAREAAFALVRDASTADHYTAYTDVARRGLGARFSGQSVREVAAELLRLAATGLRERVELGLERPEALSYLDPLTEVVSTGRTFAERCLLRWEGDIAGSPRRYVNVFRI